MNSPDSDPARRTVASLHVDVPTEERYQLFIDAVQDYAIFMLDPSGYIASWNKGAQRAKGYLPEEIIGLHFSVFYTPEDIAAGKPERELAAASAQGRVEDEGWRMRRDGSRFWADVIITAVHDALGNLVGFIKVTRDLTERRRLAELENASFVSAQMLATREDEQKRIARELHDDLGQRLTALKMSVAELEAKLGAQGASALLLSDTEGIESQIDSMAMTVRRIASDLRPPVLDDLGLEAAIEWLVDSFGQRYGVNVSARVEADDLAFSPPAATAIFRMIQEALTNVVRHAQASNVWIELHRAGDACAIRIEDDGDGATLDAPRKEKSFGLLGMHERVRQLSGSISIDSAPGEGFRIAIRLPLSVVAPDSID
ncbi:PAS domain-containing sensor histidine kinase [Trinickia dinghuensis]|uniref:PAS domain S-box protein n=1 Tax=Trinickia dinghuensis TaxID=2291023 RepID=A0A3D8K426_9BURK|nr:PAS domain-containing sensor histidine kinase [Trinickia dinghuensis]RDU99361.1 PAS domain S-box protein [Trinickia dinghuensis]